MYNTKIAFTHSHTVHTAKPSLFQDFSISLNLLHHKSLIFTQYFFFFDGAGSELFVIIGHKTFEGLGIEFLSFWKFKCVYLKNLEFLQDFKNHAGDKLTLIKTLLGELGELTCLKKITKVISSCIACNLTTKPMST